MTRAPLPLLLAAAAVLLLAGCVSPQTADRNGADSTAAASPARSETTGPSLAPQRAPVRTVQLYRGDDERALPVVSMNGSGTLTLEFDLLRAQGRPLSVYFVHADRTWRRDLSPNRVLESYHNDQLLDYRSSSGTQVPYVHYRYDFPNDDIRFRVSGNYILRVTERGRRDSVLFERPFFVTDEAGQLQLGAEAIAVPGQRQASLRPVARFQPPSSLQGDPFGYAACFVRNGRLRHARCQDRPLLVRQPELSFELERQRAFAPTTADYALDIGDLRTGPSIERTDRSASPYRILLEPDYAQFSGQSLLDADLNGQIVVRDAVRGRADPALTAEYVETTFAFVPPNERPLTGGLVVAGSFSGMDPARGIPMEWVPGRARYEGSMLLKQGRYQYFYSGEDARLETALRRSQARRQSTYTAFLYYRDPSEGTDRLLRVGAFRR
jgi:hypothetical protein